VRPLFSKKDEMSDIALTPSQRALLGLGPTSAPATPGSAYVTPPRYLRSTSRNHSVGSSRAATVGSEGLDRSVGSGSGTPGFGKSTVWDSPIAGSPLARKAMGKRASLGMGASIGDGGSPSPIGQRNVAVGLSNKFLYQRRVASNGGMTNYV
jgi:nucleoporin POM34